MTGFRVGNKRKVTWEDRKTGKDGQRGFKATMLLTPRASMLQYLTFRAFLIQQYQQTRPTKSQLNGWHRTHYDVEAQTIDCCYKGSAAEGYQR